MKTFQEVDQLFREVTGSSGRRQLISERICTEDLQDENWLQVYLDFAALLKAMENKTIRSVKWENRLDKRTNPRGVFGQFVIEYDTCSA